MNWWIVEARFTVEADLVPQAAAEAWVATAIKRVEEDLVSTATSMKGAIAARVTDVGTRETGQWDFRMQLAVRVAALSKAMAGDRGGLLVRRFVESLKDRISEVSRASVTLIEISARPDTESTVELYLDPGDAPAEVVADVLRALSDVHRAAGGSGLSFSIDEDGILLLEEEHV